jgi:glycosyltransferase involved in cell wall biosynthesis
VLPHPGGGGERYVDHLEAMPGYSFDRAYLTPDGRASQVPGGLARLRRGMREHHLVHLHGDSAGIACLPLIGSRPSVITLHGSHLIRRSSGIRGRAVRGAARRLLGRVDAAIAVSPSELEDARELAPGAADRLVLVDNGVPQAPPPSASDRAATRGQLGLGPDSVAVLFAGELSERKQPLEFAMAVQTARESNPEIAGLIAGDGELRRPLESLGADGVSVLGERDDVERLLDASDAFALPSLWEGLSYALLEAMAHGKPALVSDGRGNPDAVGDAGLVFPAGDVGEMTAGLLRLAESPELRAELGERARVRAAERFGLERMVAATADVYERALGR